MSMKIKGEKLFMNKKFLISLTNVINVKNNYLLPEICDFLNVTRFGKPGNCNYKP